MGGLEAMASPAPSGDQQRSACREEVQGNHQARAHEVPYARRGARPLPGGPAVRARVQGRPDRHPVLPQPRNKLLRGHAVHTGRAPVSPDTPQRPAQILRREHLLPQRDLRPGITASPECAGRPLRSTAELNGTHRLLPAAGPRTAGWLRSMRPARATPIPPLHPGVRSFPADVRSPAGTTTSADFCPVSPRLTARAVGAATPQHNRHPGRSPRIRTTNFPLRPPRLRDDPVDGDGLHLLEQAHPDRPAFYAVRVRRCRDSPRASFPPRLTTTQLPPARS
jgi:hypothetical protein